MTVLRLLADDLTGALDTAAEFVALTGPVPTFWHGAIPDHLPASAAIDSGTRELPLPQAASIAASLAAHLDHSGDAIAFKKIDSLIRGPTIAELAACLRRGPWRHCVLAPAFPFQGRITRDSRQYSRAGSGAWIAVSGDLVAALLGHGVTARKGIPGAALPEGISVFDAEEDADLQRVVATGKACPYPVLWSGTGGLAQAFAGGYSPPSGSHALPGPVLGVFGSDQTATAAQLAACAPHWTELPHGGAEHADATAERLATAGVALVSFALTAGTPRLHAAEQIAAEVARLVNRIDPPGSVVVAGGETLRGLCLALGTHHLDVQGRLLPGVPCSVMRGGRWDGVTVISKSGAFGQPSLLRDLLPVSRRRAS